MSTSPVLRLPAPDPDQVWKEEAKRAHFINDLEANVAQLQSCQALLHNKEDAEAFIEIFKKDIAILRLVSTEQDVSKENHLWAKCDEIEYKLNAIATQVSRIASGLSAPDEHKESSSPPRAESSEPAPQQKPASSSQDTPEAAPGGLWGGFEQLVSQIGHYAPMLLGGIGAIAAAVGAFQRWGGQSQEAASASAGQQPPPPPPQQHPSDVAAPAPQPSQEGDPSPKEVSEAPAQAPAPKESLPFISASPESQEEQTTSPACTELDTPEENFEPTDPIEEERTEEEETIEEGSEAASSSEESDEDHDHDLPPTADLTHDRLFEITRRLSNDELREYAERNPNNAVLQRWAELWERYAAVDVPLLPDLATLMANPKTTQRKVGQFFLNGNWGSHNFSEEARLRALTLLGTHYRIDRVHEHQLTHALELYNQYLAGLGSDTDREAIRLLLARSMTTKNHLLPVPSYLLRLVGIQVTVRPRRRTAATAT